MLTFPKQSEADSEQRLRWVQIATAVTAAALLMICGWYAGHTSGSVEHEHLMTQVVQSERALSSSRLEAQQRQRQAERVNAALSASGKSNAVNEVMSLQDRVRRLEAEVAQYKGMLEMNQKRADNRADMLLLLSSPGAKLMPLKGVGTQPAAVAYALVVPNSKLELLASNLTDLPDGREFQVWEMEKGEAEARSLGVFAPDSEGRAFLVVDDGAMVSDPEAVFATAEPPGGSATPTGSKTLIPINE